MDGQPQSERSQWVDGLWVNIAMPHGGMPVSKCDDAVIPDEMQRHFDVYERIDKLGIARGRFEEDVVSLAGVGMAGAVIQESGRDSIDTRKVEFGQRGQKES
jgi:hypothetical protein